MSRESALDQHSDTTAEPSAWTRGGTLASVAIVCVFWAALNWAWLSGALTIPWDAKAHFQPQLQFLASSLARGDSPFWNPHVFAGHPQIADPQSLVFSPPHVIAALLFPRPGPLVGDAVVLGALLAGALALVMLFRDRDWAPAGAVTAALVFAFGAAAAWRIQHIGQVMSLSYFAIALWLMSRAIGRRSIRWGLLAGLFVGLMILGRDQVALIGVYTLAGLIIAAWLQSGSIWRAIRHSLRPLIATGIATILTAAIPILFTLMLAEQSNRPAIDYEGAGKGSLHPASLLTLFIANLFGAAGPLENFWGQPSPAWNGFFGNVDLYLARNMSVAYLGALPLLAILAVGIIRGRAWDPPVRAIAILTALALFYALGRYTPVFGTLFQLLPGVAYYRRPADALFNVGALAAILAGYCVHVLVTRPLPELRRWQWLAITATLVAAFAAAVWLALLLGRGWVAWSPLVSAVILFALSGTMLWFLRRAQLSAPLGAALFVAALLAVDLSTSNGPSESTGLPTAQYDVLRPDTANPTVARIRTELARTAAPDRRDRVELLGIDFHWPNVSMTHGFDHVLGYNPLRLGDYSRTTGAGDHIALPDQRNFSPLFPGYRSLLADMLGLRFIVSRVPVEEVDRTLPAGVLRQIGRTSDGYIYENSAALPRVLVVPQAREANFEAIIATGIWPRDFDPRRTVTLAELPPPAPCAAAPPGTPGTASAAIRSYGNTVVTVDIVSPSCGFLVLNDAWQRWWTVEVNGQTELLLRGNVLFRAVQVPAGRSTVVFRFEPFRGLALDVAERLPRPLTRAILNGVLAIAQRF
ncbi:MAG: hypothetical protein NTZ14_05845 [Hyphomicrobiales bacterium]|nr:hypothetical protein [Hyphomicrobiales bacterium]